MITGVRIRTPRLWNHENLIQDFRRRLNADFYLPDATIDPATELLVANSLTHEELKQLPHLRALICPTSGKEGLPFAELKQRNIAVYVNAEQVGQCVAAYAEHHVLAFCGAQENRRLDGRQIIILGYGNIGAKVFEKLFVHGGDYTIVKKNITGVPSRESCRFIDLSRAAQAMADADIIVNALPFNDETGGALTRNVVHRPSAVVLGLSRAGIVDEDAVAKSVLDGTLRAAVLDVYPPQLDKLTNTHPRLILTAHTAGIWGKGTRHLIDFVLDSIARASVSR